MTPGTEPCGQTAGGEDVHRVAISAGDLSAAILTLGCTLQDVRLAGIARSLTVGSPSLAAYQAEMGTCGSIVGPVANRIGNASATIDGRTWRFDAHYRGRHTLHGGSAATHSRIWRILDTGPDHASLGLDLPHGQGGFPGNRRITARYEIAAATLRLTLDATTDAATLMNLANHSYWRLDGAPTFAGQTLRIDADRYLPGTAEDVLPTGEIADVAGTRFDYRRGRALQAGAEGLLDTNFCLSNTRRPLRPVATLTGTSGLSMTLATTEPGLQVFDGHNLGLPRYPSNDGPPHRAYAGLALEAQFWPDAPNNPSFPSILLRPGADWRQITEWRFSRP